MKFLTPLKLKEQAEPATPAAGLVAVFAKTDGTLAIKDDAGTVTPLIATGALPAVGDVQDGVTFGPGDSLTGTFEAPTESQVLESVGFGAGGTEFTGNVVLPDETAVFLGHPYGPNAALTGTLVTPSIADVRDGVFYTLPGEPDQEGTLALPTAAQVLNAVGFGAAGTEFTGNVVLPAVEDVADGVFFGPSSSLEGTLAAGGTIPGVGDVRDGVMFGEGDALEGTLGLPTESQVLATVGFGTDNTEFTGNVVLPAVGDVRDGETFGASGGSTGTLELPAESNVLSGIGYGEDGTEFTGSASGPNMTLLTTPTGAGSWPGPAMGTKLLVECWGAGANGKNGTGSSGGAGSGGGAYAAHLMDAPGGNIPYVIGAANSEVNTTFGSGPDVVAEAADLFSGRGEAANSTGNLITRNGGNGGAAQGTSSGAGGGGGGTGGPHATGANGGNAPGGGVGGAGGQGRFILPTGLGGSGGAGGDTGNPGAAATNYGGGGGGGGPVSQAGGAGTGGAIRITIMT